MSWTGAFGRACGKLLESKPRALVGLAVRAQLDARGVAQAHHVRLIGVEAL